MTVVTTSVDVDIDLSEFSDEELIEELASRGINVDVKAALEESMRWLVTLRDVLRPMRELVWEVLGRSI